MWRCCSWLWFEGTNFHISHSGRYFHNCQTSVPDQQSRPSQVGNELTLFPVTTTTGASPTKIYQEEVHYRLGIWLKSTQMTMLLWHLPIQHCSLLLDYWVHLMCFSFDVNNILGFVLRYPSVIMFPSTFFPATSVNSSKIWTQDFPLIRTSFQGSEAWGSKNLVMPDDSLPS